MLPIIQWNKDLFDGKQKILQINNAKTIDIDKLMQCSGNILLHLHSYRLKY